ncbi:uncharacterized protein LOC114740331 [Neltuma alba]|uniref:uncharacterized protein LOC114714104 n=1 Tax=Neltuma alba TaxID=207710 RepID=UPI0010A5145D|nr:uncharacterized protein LOC114714104 [Prosopis alba]XP_028784294.1 uncharacterized protein LOC114740331 [Prosopis alba]
MGSYLEEEELWKCPKHPSKRRRTGICPACLRDRLATLCPDCANVRPCSCSAATSSSSPSSSTSSSLSRLSLAGEAAGGLKRSRSVAIPFLRSSSRFRGGDREFDHDGASGKDFPGLTRIRSTRWFWSMFKPPKSSRSGMQEQNCQNVVMGEDVKSADGKTATLMKSRSVAVPDGGGMGEVRGAKKGRGWNFPSPMKAFRQSNRTSKILQEAVACA